MLYMAVASCVFIITCRVTHVVGMRLQVSAGNLHHHDIQCHVLDFHDIAGTVGDVQHHAMLRTTQTCETRHGVATRVLSGIVRMLDAGYRAINVAAANIGHVPLLSGALV